MMNDTIQKTLMTSLLFEGFWDRWVAHGLEREDAAALRPQLTNLGRWESVLEKQAAQFERKASVFRIQGNFQESERFFRISALYYTLLQWIYPETGTDKRKWYERSLKMAKEADAASDHTIMEDILGMDGHDCLGRIRVPQSPKGCIVMINPIDSPKEELFTYETDFAKAGFAVYNFDGPGQGGTYIYDGYKASRQRWNLFVNRLIDFAAARFPELPVHLFGTSSGASWALHGSAHSKTVKTAAVSPAFDKDVKMPDYFVERMSRIMKNDSESLLPEFCDFHPGKPVMIFHGNRDVMVKNDDIYGLIDQIPTGARLVEYENEGHCCNGKLNEIRFISTQWFQEDKP